MKKILLLVCFIASILSQVYSQDITFGRRIVDTLTSAYFWGRGYTNEGMHKAATFIHNEFSAYGLQPLNGKNYSQNFTYSVNTFPGKISLTINGKTLIPGKDFIVGEESKGINCSGDLEKNDSVTFVNAEKRFIVKLQDKLTWSVSQEVADYTIVYINKNLISKPTSFEVQVENKFIKKFKADNICAFVKGTEKPDSFIFITAHYDHLGGMGAETYFPGANDNASGLSLLMNLAHYYAAHPQKYSIAFICFAGEEPGLLGSKYYTENPIVPLTKIRFLINTDLAGTGEEGITIVNATEFPKEFGWMNEINDQYKLLSKINARGKAQNSDHYFFTEKGVPAFFFYTMGGIKAYHDVFDKAITLPMNEHEDLFKLLIKFNERLMKN